MTPLLGQTQIEMVAVAAALGQPAFRGRQICEWIYKHHAETIDGMSSLSKSLREQLVAEYATGRTAPVECAESPDGTKKYLFPAGEGKFIETALIPDEERATLCISTQVGCARACAFCATGQQGLQGNLSAAEILNQYASCPERNQITNIVYMGMGEPLDNLENVLRSVEIFSADYAYAKSPTRLTVSTVGILPALEKLVKSCSCHVAISMHSPFGEERAAMMPVEKQHPIKDVVEVLRAAAIRGQRRLTFEYALFDGVNDSPAHAKAVARLLKDLDCRINLIPFNAVPGSSYVPSPREKVEAFQNILKESGFVTTIRKSKGQDIAAACGMLSTARLKGLG
ncbi:MAG: 23S rRNA (adenine(2503)-C(2))-methyltransferase RlmN [Kiritimatiellia bacterium]